MSDTNDNSSQLHDQAAFDQAFQNARAGDREAVGQMLELCRDYLLLVANQDLDRDLRRKMGASDLVQESMLNAQAHFDRFEGTTKQDFLAWLRGILRNDALHWRRHYKGVQKRGSEHEAKAGDSQVPGLDPTDAFRTPSTQALAEEEQAMLKCAIDQLPENYRQVVCSRSFEEKSFAEIGQQLGSSPDAARKLWSRAIVRLQEILAKQFPESRSISLDRHDKT